MLGYCRNLFNSLQKECTHIIYGKARVSAVGKLKEILLFMRCYYYYLAMFDRVCFSFARSCLIYHFTSVTEKFLSIKFCILFVWTFVTYLSGSFRD